MIPVSICLRSHTQNPCSAFVALLIYKAMPKFADGLCPRLSRRKHAKLFSTLLALFCRDSDLPMSLLMVAEGLMLDYC